MPPLLFNNLIQIKGQRMEKKNYNKKSSSKSKTYEFNHVGQAVKPKPPSAIAKELISFSVTTDSVVATANIVVDSTHRRLKLDWGDGTTEYINLIALRQIRGGFLGFDTDPNTLKFQHVYQSPNNSGQKIVRVESTDTNGDKFTQRLNDVID